MLLTIVLAGCLVNTELYEQMKAELADDDGDGVVARDDCDDHDPDVYPGADEVCDGVDQDCDDEIDEGLAALWYLDADGDGYGDENGTVEDCAQPEGTAANDDDCDDEDATVNPAADDEPYDGIDQDCDSADLTDVDRDGYDADAAGGSDCDDDDASVYPGAPEDWLDDGTDNDCDGTAYEDQTWSAADAFTRIDGVGPSDEFGRRLGVWLDEGCLFVSAPYAEDYAGVLYAESALSTGHHVAGDGGALVGSEPGAALSNVIAVSGDGRLVATEAGAIDSAGKVWLLDAADPCGGYQGAISDIALSVVEGVGATEFLGNSAVWLPDLDGDGVEELAGGAAWGEGTRGAVYIWWGGPPEGTTSAADADVIVTGDEAGAYLQGVRAAWASTGTGTPDLLFDQAAVDGGDPVVVRVATDDLASGAVSDFATGWMYSWSTGTLPVVEVVGDMDRDGDDNVVAGVWTMDLWNLSDFEGAVEEGSSGVGITVDEEGEWLTGFAALGDLDGDDRSDFAILAEDWPEATERGLLGILTADAYNPFGDNDLSDVRLKAEGAEAGDSFGYRVVPVGDLDGDGRDDLAVGAYGTDHNGPSSGSVYLVPSPF